MIKILVLIILIVFIFIMAVALWYVKRVFWSKKKRR